VIRGEHGFWTLSQLIHTNTCQQNLDKNNTVTFLDLNDTIICYLVYNLGLVPFWKWIQKYQGTWILNGMRTNWICCCVLLCLVGCFCGAASHHTAGKITFTSSFFCEIYRFDFSKRSVDYLSMYLLLVVLSKGGVCSMSHRWKMARGIWRSVPMLRIKCGGSKIVQLVCLLKFSLCFMTEERSGVAVNSVAMTSALS
jgi:hypothetical protein